MINRIEIGLKKGVRAARGEGIVSKARTALGLKLQKVATRAVYKIDAALTKAELKSVCRYFRDPVVETTAIGRIPPPPHFDWLIEIAYKPGVTDNVGKTALVALRDILDRKLNDNAQVYTAVQYFISAKGLARVMAQKLASDLLANQLIQTIFICSATEWRKAPVDLRVPAIHEQTSPEVGVYDLSGSDADLMRISHANILSLSLAEMQAIRAYFRNAKVRKARRTLGLPARPTDVELECIAQTWSEHCSHKIFSANIKYTGEAGRIENIRSLFKTYIRAATEKIGRSTDWLVSVFKDNAGIIRFNKRQHLVYKIETHNSPSALDPYGGAMTGIVGVNRDPMGTGMGAQLLCNVWGYCLGSPFYAGEVPKGLMHPRRIRDGVHQGVIEGGNQSGIPWMRGWEIFDERFTGKPLVFCGTVGTLPVKVGGRPSERKEVKPGDLIVMVGGRIGKDGIHGATFSSEELREKSPVQAVQIGDPITQRKMYEFLMEARDRGLYRCITDNGAGGLSCSVGEMGKLSGGAELDLGKAPLKYEGLKPWEILLSEAQERMTLAVPPARIRQFVDLAKKRDVEATALGTFTGSSAFTIRHKDRVVGCLDMKFLYEGCPIMELEALWQPPRMEKPAVPRPGKRDLVLCDLLSSLDICSKEYKSRQYDGEVKGLSVVKPYVGVLCDVPADATVMRVEYGSNEGIVLTEGINPFYSDLDTYHMTAAVIDEAVRRAVSAGGRLDRIAGLDNFCWPDPALSEKTPDGRYKLAQLVRACRALYDVTTAYGVPCISGKDSCKNDSTRGGRKISIPPTLLFSTLAKIDDVRKAVTLDFKSPGDLIYVLGATRAELGASAYYRLLSNNQGRDASSSLRSQEANSGGVGPRHPVFSGGSDPGFAKGYAEARSRPYHFEIPIPQNHGASYGGNVPVLDPAFGKQICKFVEKAIKSGIIRSCHAPAKGGLAVGFALCALGGNLGAEIELGAVIRAGILDDDALLFSESNSRFIVTVSKARKNNFERVLRGIPCACVGSVTNGKKLIVTGTNKNKIISVELERLRNSFKKTLYGI